MMYLFGLTKRITWVHEIPDAQLRLVHWQQYNLGFENIEVEFDWKIYCWSNWVPSVQPG